MGNTYIHGKTCSLHHFFLNSKLACGIERGGVRGGGGWWHPTRLDLTFFADTPPSSFLFLCPFFCYAPVFLAKEANRTNFKSKLLVGIPKVIYHDVNDWNLIYFGSVDFHHCLSIALPCRALVCDGSDVRVVIVRHLLVIGSQEAERFVVVVADFVVPRY